MDRGTEELARSTIQSATLTSLGKPSILVEAGSTELLPTFNHVEAYLINVEICAKKSERQFLSTCFKGESTVGWATGL